MTMVASTPRQIQLRNWNYGVYIVTALVWLLVVLMRSPNKISLPATVDLTFIPAANALLNTIVCLLLMGALIAIKNKMVSLHKTLMTSAMGISGVFLLLYTAYHFTTPMTVYGGEGFVKVLYLTLLGSHIVLAALSLPLILKMWVFGYLNEVERHRRMGRWVYPVWLYVAATGPICYLMLSPYYS